MKTFQSQLLWDFFQDILFHLFQKSIFELFFQNWIYFRKWVFLIFLSILKRNAINFTTTFQIQVMNEFINLSNFELRSID
jgi:hypothetical protein